MQDVKPIKIIFLCEGNVCRSPSAEWLFKKLVKDAGLEDRFVITSRGTLNSTRGEDIYSFSKEVLNDNGIPYEKHSAKPIEISEYREADYVIVMENYNSILLKRLLFTKDYSKIHRLLEYTDREKKDIADPYQTRDFKTAYNDIHEGCLGLLSYFQKKFQEQELA